MSNVLNKIKCAPLIILKRHVVLRINSFHLSLNLAVTEQRAKKELSEAVEGGPEGLIRHFEVIVSVC